MKKQILLLVVLCASLLAAGAVYAATASVVTVDDGGGDDVGYYTALAIDANGNAIIAYYDWTNGELKMAFCNDQVCSSPTIQTMATGLGGLGSFTSIALDASGNPVVSYYTTANFGTLRLLTCFDPTCAASANLLVEDNGVGSYTSLALNSSGNAVISYYGPGTLKLAYCTNIICSTNVINTVDDGGGVNDVGLFSSLKLGAGGFPVIAYYDADADSVKLARCNDVDCTLPATINTVDDSSHVGFNGISLELRNSGFPVMSYYDVTNQRLKLASCVDADCTAPPVINVVDSGDVGEYSSLKLDGNLPVISYFDNGNGDLKLARCLDPNCASADIQVVDDSGEVGWDTSLQLGSAHISYYDVTNDSLKFAFIPDDGTVPAPVTVGEASPQALPATGFAPGGVAALPATRPEYAATQMELIIPALDVHTTILGVPQADGSWDVSWLGSQAGHLQGTAWPTWLGNSVLTGHVWDADNTPGVFAGIHTLKYGDQVEIRADGRSYTYEVRHSQLVLPKNLNVLTRNDGYSWVTLLTCELFNPFSGDYFLRRAVSAVLVSVE
ncbi:MAG: class F sortase [Anaerolineales bacterium]|nr:class F sortase [Anaerolineales bacterium]